MSRWAKVKLSDVGKVVTGNTPPTKNPEYYSSNDIAFYKPNDLTETEVLKLDRATVYVSESAKSKIRLLPKGSVLVTCIGIIGKVGIALDKCTCNQQINAIIPNTNMIDSGYLAYCIMNKKDYIRSIANAPIVPIINKTQFSNVQIPLPPLETQKQIAKTLDTAAELLAMRKQQLEELDNLIKSTFYNMFGDPVTNEKGWEIRRIVDIAKVETGSTPSRNNMNYYDEGIVPWVKTGEISNGYIFKAEEKISEIAVKETNCKVFPYNTILVAMYGQGKTRGQAGMLKIEAATNQACAAILPSDLYISEFLFRLLEIKYEDLRELGRGGNQQNLNLSIVKDFKIIVPSLTFQTQFAEIVTKIEEQKALVKKAIDETQYLFDSLMSEYFA